MKKLILLCLLALCLTTSCSKSKKTDEENVPSNTVDLGEASEDENGNKADKADSGDKAGNDKKANRDDSKRPKKRAKDDGPDKGRKGSATDEEREMARRNDEASKNPDGSSKRGKPAAEIEAEEARAKAEAENKNIEDNNADNKADNNEAASDEIAKVDTDAPEEGFDFSDEDEKIKPSALKPPREPRVKLNLEIEKYINIREFREQTGYSGSLGEDWLMGQHIDARYTSARLSTNDSSQLGFSIQIWRPGNESAANKRFTDLFSQSFGGQKIKNIANDAFISKHHKIVELGFFEKGKRATVLLSCSENICSQEQLKSIALIIQRRL